MIMQPIIKKIFNEILNPEEQITSLLMEDNLNDYYVFAWIKDNELLQLGYGKADAYLSYKPSISQDENISVIFPYENLTEKESYILFRYEKTKFKMFDLKNIKYFGIDNMFV